MVKLEIKQWTKELEKPIYELWKKERIYKFNKNTKKKIYSIDTPPPYINTPVHIGQATTYVLMDMFARFRRMIGQEVLFPLGLDKNGLPIEIATEKKFNIKLTETPREKFLELCKKLLDEAGSATIESFLRLGISFNSFEKGEKAGEIYETDSENYRALTQSTFIDLWSKGLIYEDERINNWDPKLQTTLADSEINYEDIPTLFNEIKFKVKETNEEIIIGTTRPELICTCATLIYNPKDKRYIHLKNKTAITPIYNKEIKIVPHPLAQIDKGTGLVMMCSAGDLSDIRFFREMNLDPIIAIEKDGRMNHHSGFLKGLKVKEARGKIIEELRNKNLLIKQTSISHRTPISERSGVEIEFISMKEFYIKQLDFKDKMKEIANQVNFFSPESRNILLNWIESISIDWPISRRRYYATEIPLWYCQNCSEVILPQKGKYYQPWKSNPPVKECPKCKSKKFIGEQRVFDTWFDSSISPLYILMYERDNDFFKKSFPCILRPSGKEIVRTWGYYTLLRCYQLTNKAIFKDYWVNYHIVDESGRKMSKSLGNVIDPKIILDKFGAEPFRLWAVIEGNLDKTDFRCSLERIEGASKTITKLLNVSKFIFIFNEVKKPKKLENLDLLIINELNNIIKFARNSYEKYDFHNPAIKLKIFLWDLFASHYMELVKARAYNQDKKFTKEQQDSAIFTLYHCLDKILKLLAPINPFITYKIYKVWKNKDIHLEKFPKIEKVKKIDFNFDEIMELNSQIWNCKKTNNQPLNAEIIKATIPRKFKILEKDLVRAHKIKEVNFGKKLEICI
ncbi:valine--tRNA ligase [Candidatus Woesearchaeota archaeon]|nr:valine--tRNA ligase [Candidatus Woesearchaeota archaeon]